MAKLKTSVLALLALLPFGAVPALATTTILASIQEDIGSTFQGTVAVNTTAANFDSTYSRLALNAAGSTTAPPPNRVESGTFSAASGNFWFSAQLNANTATSSNSIGVGFYDGATVRLLLRGTGTNQQIKASTRNGAGTIADLATASGSLCAATRCRLDCHVVYAVAGSIDCYVSGSLILTFTGDITTNGATTLDKAFTSSFNTSGSTAFWSEVFVADADTRSMRSLTCAPSAAGATQNWTGSAGNINANSFADATFNNTTVNNDLSQWTVGCTVPSLSAIFDVRSYGRLAIGASGPQNAAFSLHVGGTDNTSASVSGITTSFANFVNDWGANSPTSALPWTRTDLTSSFSFGVKSQP